MPVALGLLWVELKALYYLFIDRPRSAARAAPIASGTKLRSPYRHAALGIASHMRRPRRKSAMRATLANEVEPVAAAQPVAAS